MSSQVPRRYRGLRLDNFKAENKNQQEVLNICKEFVNGKYNTGLIMIGRNGTGKSMLCSIILQELIRNNPDDKNGYESYKRLYTEAIKLVRLIKKTWNKNSEIDEQDAINKFIIPEVLIIDEIGVQYGSPTEAQFITEIINDRYNQKKATILSGNLTIEEIKGLIGDRVIDRFRDDGKVLVFDWNSYRGKKEGIDYDNQR